MHPSAGAIHPVHVLLQRAHDLHWERYDANAHCLTEIPGSAELAQAVRRDAEVIVSGVDACLIALVAEPQKTHAKYDNANSLVMRDAGVVLGYLSIVSELIGASYCPLGSTGHERLKTLLPKETLWGLGLAWFGSRADKPY